MVLKMVEAGGGETFSTRTAARILAVTPERIRYWVKRNLVRPLNAGGRKYRFGFNDLLEMRLAKELLGTRQHIDPIQRCLERVRTLRRSRTLRHLAQTRERRRPHRRARRPLAHRVRNAGS